MKGKTRREGAEEGDRQGRGKEGEGYSSILKSNGAGGTALDGEVRGGLSKAPRKHSINLCWKEGGKD